MTTELHSLDRMPTGLPARFTSGKEGLTNLQEVLGLPNRKELQSVLRVSVVRKFLKPLKSKLRRLKTSQRLEREAIAFYSDPFQRLLAWQFNLVSSQLESELVIPSLDLEAMKRYEPDFLHSNTPRKTIDESLAMFSGYCYYDWEDYPLDTISLFHVWPALRHDLLQWETLSFKRQDEVALAIFAVATVLNDARFLAWAASHVERLAVDFAFALQQYGGDYKFLKDDRTIGIAGYEDILKAWNRNCDFIVEIAEELWRFPLHYDRLDEIHDPIKRLKELRKHLKSAILQRDRTKLIEGIGHVIDSCAGECHAPWLASVLRRVIACWKLEYIFGSDFADSVFTHDVERCKTSLTAEVRSWRQWEDAKLECRTKLRELEFSSLDSLELQLDEEDQEAKLHKEMADVARRANDGKRRILKALSPRGAAFDPARDYEKDLEKAQRNSAFAAAAVAANLNTSASAEGEDASASADQSGGDPNPVTVELPATAAAEEQDARDEPRPPDVEGESAEQIEDSGAGAQASARVDATADNRHPSDPELASSDAFEWRTEGLKSIRDQVRWAERVARDREWYSWLDQLGNLDPHENLELPNLRLDPRMLSIFSFSDPRNFANSLSERIQHSTFGDTRASLETLTTFLYSDPRKGHPDWYPIYSAILRYALDEKPGRDNHRMMAFLLFELMIGTNRNTGEYRSLVDSAGTFAGNCAHDGDVQVAVELAEIFLGKSLRDREYLVHNFIELVLQLSTSSPQEELPHRLQKVLREMQNMVMQCNGEIHNEVLSEFLRGKKMLIYTLQLTTAKTLKSKLETIEPSVRIRLLDNEVWNDSLTNPVRNADVCLMVKSASKHNMIDMIARVRHDAGKDVLEPASRGVESAMREIYRAAGITESEIASGFVTAIHTG